MLSDVRSAVVWIAGRERRHAVISTGLRIIKIVV
jgi:hypothetical protein